MLGQGDAATNLGRDVLDTLHHDVVGIDHEYIAPLVHEFDNQTYRGIAHGDAGIGWWGVFVGVAWFGRFDYTNDYDAFERGLFDSTDTPTFEVFAHQQQERRGELNPTRDFFGMDGDAGQFWMRRKEQPYAPALMIEFERNALR